MYRLCSALFVLASAAVVPAAELPLGLVERAEQDVVMVRFDAAARIAGGQMVALFGPGQVTKHPLSGKVVTEQRKLLAKGQAIAFQDGLVRLRVLWRDGSAVPVAGWDAVPLPGEAAPNAPPVVASAIQPLSAPGGATVAVKLPVSDPDGDPMTIAWELVGPAGRCGRLDVRVGALPEVLWTAPAVQPEGGMAVKAVIRDPLGQEATVSVPLTVAGNDDPRHPRKVFATLGSGLEPSWIQLDRSDDGGWIGVDESGKVQRSTAGWQQTAPIALGDAARRPIAVAARGKDIYVLDREKLAVVVFSDAGQPRRTLGGLLEPSDLAVGPDGSVYVADQRSGGVMVFDPSGRFRARAGRIGDDGFVEVSRVAVGPGGDLAALDPAGRRLHRFDRDLKRLDTWTITGDPKLKPVDLAIHARGLLVVLDDGSVQLYAGKGTIAETWKPASAAGLVDAPRAALAITADLSGETLICHAGGVTARFAADGRVVGVRGAELLASASGWAADGLGRLFTLDVDYGLISVIDAEGWRIARIGGRARGGGPFSEAAAMAVAPDGSGISVVDADKRTIVRFDGRDLRKPPLIFGGKGSNNGQLSSPIALAMDEAGRTYVLDEDLYRVSVFDAAGQFLFTFGEKGSGPNQLDEPGLVAVASAGDAAYIYDGDRYEMKKYALDQQARTGHHTATGGGKGGEPGQFRKPVAMRVDRTGLLHVLDTSRGDWQLIDFRGQSLLPLAARKTEEMLRGASAMAVAPDGQFWLAGGGAAVGVR